MDEPVDQKYNALNEFLDECINEVLRETNGQFQVRDEDRAGVDYDQVKKSDRFKGFKEDKLDPEGEKMKDYEKAPSYKVYKRPLTTEETKSWQQYEKHISNLKPGEHKPQWDGLDKSIPVADKTEEYSQVRNTKTSKQTKEPPQMYPQPEQKQEREKDTYDPTLTPRKSNRSKYPYWAFPNDANNRKNDEMNQNPYSPKTNPDIYWPKVEEKPSKVEWNYKPKFSNSENAQSTYQRPSETDVNRRFSDPSVLDKQRFTSLGGFQPEDEYQTAENFYKTVAKSDLKPGYNQDPIKTEPPVEAQKESKENEDDEKMLPGLNSEKVKEELLKLRPRIMDRTVWGALPPMGKITPMKPPADTVVFTLSTGTQDCVTEDECRRAVREIQARHMGQGLADIQYNFLVGGDGNLYEGRGWGFESGIKEEKKQGKSYNIAFIGDYQGNTDKIPPHMLLPVQELIVWANAIRLMTKDTLSAGEYRVTQNQDPKIENK